MDTCSERSYRSQKSSVSYTGTSGTINSRRPLLGGGAQLSIAPTGGHEFLSYYSDDEPQRRRSLHRHGRRNHPPPPGNPPPPVPPSAGPPPSANSGYIEMSSSPRITHNKKARNSVDSSVRNSAKFDKRNLYKMASQLSNQVAARSDSEFTDQSDAPNGAIGPGMASLRQRYFVNQPISIDQHHNNGPITQPLISQSQSQGFTSLQTANHQASVPVPVAGHVMSQPGGGGAAAGPGVGRMPARANGFPPQMIPPLPAAIPATTSFDQCEAWERDTVITGASNKSSSMENLPDFLPAAAHPPGSNKSLHNSTNHSHQNGGFMLPAEESEYGYVDSGPSVGICSKYFTPTISLLIIALIVITPPLFVLLPPFFVDNLTCEYDCIGTLVSLFFKSIILVIGCWAVFFRSSRSSLPSVHLVRAFLICFTLLFLAAHWVSFALKVAKHRISDSDFKLVDYLVVLQFSTNTIDCALFIYYLAVIALEIVHLRTEYIIKVVRNTDGESRFYTIGRMSIQSCACWVLQQYYKDFSVYNPTTHPTSGTSSKGKNKVTNASQQYKFYDIDGFMQPQNNNNATTAIIDKSRAIIAASARKRDASHNDRFYEEQDLERRIKKRRARLIVAAEEAFSHLRRAEEEDSMLGKPPMSPSESANAIFPSMARALQKYLKITNQQYRYTQDAIYDHLARCLTLDFTPKAFLEKYLNPGPVITSEAEQKPVQSWELISENFLNRSIHENVVFQLKQENVSLIVYVAKVPHLYVKESSADPSHTSFVLRLESETSV